MSEKVIPTAKASRPQHTFYTGNNQLVDDWLAIQTQPSKAIRELIIALVHQYGIQDWITLKASLQATDLPLLAQLQPITTQLPNGRLALDTPTDSQSAFSPATPPVPTELPSTTPTVPVESTSTKKSKAKPESKNVRKTLWG